MSRLHTRFAWRRRLGPPLRALLAHKLRAALALACIAIGVAALVVTGVVSAGVQRDILRQIDRMGSNLLVIRPAQVKRLVARKAVRGNVRTLVIDDYEAIAALPLVAQAAPGLEGVARVKHGDRAISTSIRGTSPAFPALRRFRLRAGRFFDADDDRAARRVAVLAARVADTLFAGETAAIDPIAPIDPTTPIGREIRIRGVPFEVIGVLEAKGVLADGSDEDNQVLVPIRTALRRIFNATWLDAVFVSVRDLQQMDAAVETIGALLRARHRAMPDDFAIQNTTRTLAIQMETARLLGRLTSGLAVIALLIGGTGILALMLMAVKERTNEIGLRRAVGATPADVFTQFLLESISLAIAGWLAGLAIGAIAAAAITLGAERLGPDSFGAARFDTPWPLAMPVEPLLGSFALVLLIGAGFGAVPARAAARLTPIDALRAE